MVRLGVTTIHNSDLKNKHDWGVVVSGGCVVSRGYVLISRIDIYLGRQTADVERVVFIGCL